MLVTEINHNDCILDACGKNNKEKKLWQKEK